jgi:hypothetical protein
MARNNWCFAVTGLCWLAACGGSPDEQEINQWPDGGTQGVLVPDAGGGAGSTAALPASGGRGVDAAVTGSQPATSQPTPAADGGQEPQQIPDATAGNDSGPAPTKPFDYMMQTVSLTSDLVIPKGKLVRVGPGVTFNAKSASVKIDVQGELQVEGTAAAPVTFSGTGNQSSWHGIVVEAGGKLSLSQVKIGGAQYGVHAMPGSMFSIDRAVIDTSFKAAVVQSNGSITNSTFKAVFLLPAVTDAVAIDDPNGALTVMDASPTVTNCRFEGSGGLNDMIRVGGQASPVFDHIYVGNSHCGFHISGGTNNSPKITNTVFEKLSYGIMAYASAPIVEDSVFLSSGSDIGMCSGATTDNAAKLRNNSYVDGQIHLDASCDRIGTKDTAPAKTPNASAGPSGL